MAQFLINKWLNFYLRNTFRLKGFIPLRYLLKDSFSWCPDCIKDWQEDDKVIYYPLIWHIKLIGICKKHNRFLIDICPVCNKAVHILRRQMFPGYCPNCFSLLSNSIESKKYDLAEVNWELFVYENIEDLLSINPNKLVADRFKFLDVLNSINKEFFSSNIASFSRYLRIQESTLRYWLYGKSFPSLGNMLKVCFKLNKNIKDLLLGFHKLDVNILQNYSEQLIEHNKIKNAPEPLNFKEIERKLIELSSAEIPISMNSAAKIIGRDRRVLYRNFPNLCKQISKRYKDYIKEKSEQRIKWLKEQIKLAFNELKSEGVYPSSRKVEERVGKSGVLKEKVLQDYWRILLIQNGYKD